MGAAEKVCGPHMKLVSKEIVHRLLFNIVTPQLHTLLPGSLQCLDACLEGLVFVLQLMYSKRSILRKMLTTKHDATQITWIFFKEQPRTYLAELKPLVPAAEQNSVQTSISQSFCVAFCDMMLSCIMVGPTWK